MKSEIVTVPFHKPALKEGAEYRLMLSFRQKEKTLWADPEFEVAWDQFDLSWHREKQDIDNDSFALARLTEETGSVRISGNNFDYTVQQEFRNADLNGHIRQGDD